MGNIAGYLFTKEHAWIKAEGLNAKIGITDYAQKKLGDIMFVELPAANRTLKKSDVLATVESVKAASDIYSPAGGKVLAVNRELENTPELINRSPYDEGWIAEIELSDQAETENLLTEEDYQIYIKGLE